MTPKLFAELKRLAELYSLKATSYTFVRQDNNISCQGFTSSISAGTTAKVNHKFPEKPVIGMHFAFFRFKKPPKSRSKNFNGITIYLQPYRDYWTLYIGS